MKTKMLTFLLSLSATASAGPLIIRSTVPYRIDTYNGPEYAQCIAYFPMEKVIKYTNDIQYCPVDIFRSGFEGDS